MKASKNLIFYISTIGLALLAMYLITVYGSGLEIGRNVNRPVSSIGQWDVFTDTLLHNLKHPLAKLLLQIITIMISARIFGWLCKKIGQPSVVGEIAAGIFLGPSLIGLYFPEFSAVLFPKESLANLGILSQIGLILFMFVIGMELDLKVLRNKAQDAIVVSHASIVFPFTLGMGLAYFVYSSFAPPNVQFLSFGLFLGIAMSITAFPVLARIVQERGIHKTRLGTIVITCAAADDITAWCMLAAVIAIVKAGSVASSIYIIILSVIYVIFMLAVIRPFLKRIGELHASRENLSKPIVAIFFVVLLASAYATEVIGIHALFGAFMAGTVMPENSKFRNIFIEKVEDVSLVLLLPLFFVFTGLRTQIGLLNDWYLWQITGLIILVAVVGKFVGSALAARFVGQPWKDSLTIGALMNTRGLMELVVLNIGYDLGVLTPEIFAMMVIMALVTTAMTGPSIDLINYFFKEPKNALPFDDKKARKFKILISFGNPQRGSSLLRLANGLIKKQKVSASVTAMHLSPSTQLNQYNSQEYERESFKPILETSTELGQKVTTYFKASADIDTDIVDVANKGKYDLLMIGLGQSIFEGSLLGKLLGFTTKIISPDRLLSTVTGKNKLFEQSPFDDRTKLILSKAQTDVGILIDKELKNIDRIFVPIFEEKDIFLIKYINKFINNLGTEVIILDAAAVVKRSDEIKGSIQKIESNYPDKLSVVELKTVEKELMEKTDLMLISLESWRKLVDTQSIWLNYSPSTLIIKPKS
jgi:Kef-type K+ transport system membrane component KefB